MEYLVCEAGSAEKIQDQVNERMRDGWQPIGGLSVVQSQSSNRWWYYQALVRGEAEASGSGQKSAYSGLGELE